MAENTLDSSSKKPGEDIRYRLKNICSNVLGSIIEFVHFVAALVSGVVILVLSNLWILNGWISLISYILVSFAVFSGHLFL